MVDDSGQAYEAEVAEVGETQTLLRILGRAPAAEAQVRITLGQAVLKSKKMDWVIQKATELGVDVLVPLISSRSVVKIGPGEGPRVDRWRRIAREASKQSRRASLPEVQEPRRFPDFLSARAAKKFMLTETGGTALKDILARSPGQPAGTDLPAVLLAVGPEGGWTPEEENAGRAAGFEAVSLGQQTLRSETAALAALAMISHFWKT